MVSTPTAVERAMSPPRADTRFVDACQVVGRLHAAGYETYLVGGCVRDLAIGREPKDYDIATIASPDEVCSLFRRTIGVGKAFGVVQVKENKAFYEVATFRKDLEYSDGRRPEEVVFCDSREDVQRRDFTVNGLLYDIEREVIVDWVGGLKDLDRRKIVAIGEPERRFREDHLRILRAVRFAVQLDFEIDGPTWD